MHKSIEAAIDKDQRLRPFAEGPAEPAADALTRPHGTTLLFHHPTNDLRPMIQSRMS